MRIPEKKQFKYPCCEYGTCVECMGIEGFNQACEEWEAYHLDVCKEVLDENNKLIAEVKALLIAIKFSTPPINLGGTKEHPNLCWDARIPIGFVDSVEKQIKSLALKVRGEEQ